MIKHLSLVCLSALVAGAAAACALGTPATVAADDVQTSTAAVTFTAPTHSAMKASDMPAVDFSDTEVSGQTQDVTATSVSAPVAVDDPGYANGWSVSVSASEFTNADNAKIHAAQLTFDATAAQSADGTQPTVSDTVVACGGDAQTLVSADADTTGSTYTTHFAPSAVHLHIPAGNAQGSYSAALSWTLTNAVE